MKADLENLEMFDASDIYPRRIKAKEVLISQKDDEFVFPFASGTAKLSGRDYEFRVPTQRRINMMGVKVSAEKFEANRKSLNWQNHQMMLKPMAIFGRFKVTSSIVITLNHEYNSR